MTCCACGGDAWERRYRGVADYEYETYHPVDYAACRICGLLAQDPLPKAEDVPGFYPAGYRLHDVSAGAFARLKQWQAARLARTMSRSIVAEARILELGCGRGDLLRAFRARGYRSLYGSDFVATGAAALERDGISFRRADLETTFPFEGAFDAVIMNNVIEHFLDPAGVLARARDRLSPGGALILVTPNAEAWDRSVFGRSWAGFHAPRHTFVFTRRALEALGRRLGFSRVVVRALVDPGQWALSLQNACQASRLLRTALARGLAWYTLPMTAAFVPVAAIQALTRRSASMLAVVSRN